MNKVTRLMIASLLCCGSFLASAQADSQAVPTGAHRWTFYGGIGPNYYFNNLEVANQRVNEVNYTFIARMMWEPEHKLALGVETGYIRLYNIKGSNATLGDVKIVNVAIPIQIVISMKFLKNYYGNFSMGQSILLNLVDSSLHGNFDASSVSLGDFGATIGYRKLVKDRLYLGAELKGYYSAKLDDKNMSLLFMTGYRLW